MKRLVIPAVAIAAVALALGVVLLANHDRIEQERFERGESELIVSNLAQSNAVVFKAGRTLDDTVRIAAVGRNHLWLPPGNYIVRSEGTSWTLFYPVPLTGYRCGPDEDGSYLVTVRSLPQRFPPKLLPALPEFVFIPSGTFLLGDRQNPREPHYVWLTGFFIAPFEVTNEEFRAFLHASDGYNDEANWTDMGKRWRNQNGSHASALLTPTDRDYERFGAEDLPVTRVTWYEANAFRKWLTRKFLGWLFTLPNDAMWEKAARGPDNFDYSLSRYISDEEALLYNWRKNSDAPVPLFGMRSSLQRFRPNRYGIYHMTGNVVEWTQSVEQPYNRERPYVNNKRNHDDTAGKRTARGGSWYSAATSYLYIPYRDSFQPEHSSPDVGFRIVAKPLP